MGGQELNFLLGPSGGGRRQGSQQRDVGHRARAKFRLDEYYHDHDPGYLADLSYSIHNMTFRDYQNDAELFLYALNHKTGLLLDRTEYAIPIQTKITILIRALKLDSRFDAIVSKHAVDPYTGETGYLKACQTAVTFARRLRLAHTPADAPTPAGRTEHTAQPDLWQPETYMLELWQTRSQDRNVLAEVSRTEGQSTQTHGQGRRTWKGNHERTNLWPNLTRTYESRGCRTTGVVERVSTPAVPYTVLRGL